mmetsp:Transcript_19467/g.41637  ORF Transcript_19467/g.41637 Transcript_19467/m.41637 type:complete len:360 (-) Transcript_19467:182-1261(-)
MGGEEAEMSESDMSEAADFDIATVDGPALTPQISGIVGLCITSFLWVIASWRLLYHYSGWCSKCCKRTKEDEEINHLRTDGLTTKRLLHGLLWTAMVVEGVAYADMVGTNSSNKLNYVLLDIIGRGILEFSTFVIGTVHWFNITSQARAGDKKLAFAIFPAILAILTIAVTVSSTFEAVTLLHGGYDTVHGFRSQSDIHRITLLVESVGWGIHAGIVAICGRMVYLRISSLPTFSQVRSHAKRNIITKMIIPMIFCALSYLLRSGWMAADFASRLVSPETTFEQGVGWWVGNCWVPTFIPSIMLLYSIRKRDREPGSIDGVPETLLQSPNAEMPADPFQSFQQTFRDFEDEDASLPSKK